jgi:integrase
MDDEWTKPEAEDHEARILIAIKNGTYRTEGELEAERQEQAEADAMAKAAAVRQAMAEAERRITVADFFETFVADHVAGTKKLEANRPSEIQIKRKASRYYLPLLGDKQLDALTDDDVSALVDHLKAEGLAVKTQKTYRDSFRRLLRYAVEKKVLGADKLPAFPTINVPEADIRWFNAEESAKLIDVAEPEWRTMILVALRTAGRIGEVLGLQWTDVDWHTGMVHIQRSVGPDGIGPTKTGRNRHVPLAPDALAALKAHPHRLNCPWVFPAADGGHMVASQTRRAYERALKAAGLSHAGWHSTRHSAATQAILNGAPDYLVSAFLGQEDPTMVKRYVHVAGTNLRGITDGLSRGRVATG